MVYAAVQQFFARLAAWPLPLRLAALAGVAGLFALPLAAFSASLSGLNGVAASLTAEMLCFAGVAAGEVAAAIAPAGPSLAFGRYVLGMFPRLGVPLGLGVWLQQHDAALAAAGFIFYLIFFYMLTLSLEVAALVAALPKRRAEGVA
jgi:hypothetical protein